MIGAVLAGGLGGRLGGAKAGAELAGRPLVSYPIAALEQVCERVVVVCKRDTDLAAGIAVERWHEPDEPRHPIAGIVHALEAAGEPVLVCAADMPFLTGAAVGQLAQALGEGPAAVAVCDGRLEPLLGAYGPAALGELRAAAPDAPLRRTVESLDPVTVEVPAELVFNVNTPADLAEAERRLST